MQYITIHYNIHVHSIVWYALKKTCAHIDYSVCTHKYVMIHIIILESKPFTNRPTQHTLVSINTLWYFIRQSIGFSSTHSISLHLSPSLSLSLSLWFCFLLLLFFYFDLVNVLKTISFVCLCVQYITPMQLTSK